MKLRLPKTRRYRVLLYFLSITLILLAIDLLWVRIDRHITIATDTTFLTSPLTPDGRIDYLRAVNSSAGEGIPPEKNAAIPLLQIFGPSMLNDRTSHETYARLGMTYPGPTEKFFTRFYQYYLDQHPGTAAEDITGAEERFQNHRLHLWTAADDSATAAYLELNATFLNRSVELLTRPSFYVPLFSYSGDHLLISVSLPLTGADRELARALADRATLQGAAGDFEGARRDIRIMQSISQQENSRPFLLAFLISTLIDTSACETLQTLATQSSPSSAQCKTLLADLDNAPPITLLNAFNSERLLDLDCLQYGARTGPAKAFSLFSPPDPLHKAFPLIRAVPLTLVPANFNQALRDTNRYFDDLVDATRQPTYADRIARAKAAEQSLQRYAARLGAFSDPAQRIRCELLPSIAGALKTADNAIMLRDLTRLALALAAYHADRHAYPATLAELTPAYLPVIPQDLFIDAPLHFTKTPDGYLLYSVGINMIDDHAHNKTYRDPANPKADDLVIRVGPAPATGPATQPQ